MWRLPRRLFPDQKIENNRNGPCPCRKLKPEHIDGVALPRSAPQARSHCPDLARHGGVLVQREVRASLIVVSLVRMKQMTKMAFAQDNDMVKAVPPDRAAEPLHVSVLPGRARRDRSVANAYSPDTPNEGLAISGVSIANKIARRFLPAVRFDQLLRDPLGARMGRYPDPQQLPARMLQNQ